MVQPVIDAKLVKKITEEIWDSGTQRIDLQQRCAEELNKHLPHVSSLEIYDILGNVVYKVKFQLRKKITHCLEKGVTPRYEFSDAFPNLLRATKDIHYLRKIKSAIKNMSWIKFQHLCKHLLEVNGIEEAEVTRGSKEGGIDFYGLLRINKFSSGVLLKGWGIRIIGQARHHSTHAKVGETDLKVFAQECDDFKNGRSRGTQVLPEWFIYSKSPVIPMFITNTGFTKGAYNLAERKGIILRDGDHIAEDLVHSQKLYEWFNSGEKGSRIAL